MGCRWEEKHERKWVGRNLLSGLHSTIPVHPTQIKFSRNLKKFSTAAEAGAAPGGWGEGNCVLIRLPDTLRRTDSLEGRKAGKMCRKRSFSAFLPSKSALCQATGYAGELQIADLRLPAGCDLFRAQKLGRNAVGVQARRAKSPFRERQRRSIIQPRVAAAAKRRRLLWVCVPK
jgi:hypothetical protein